MKKILKRIVNYKFHLRFLFSPFIRFQISTLGSYQGVTKNKREVPIIISLTSYNERFRDLPLVLYSLIDQSIKADRIILWLDEDDNNLLNLPYDITKFIKNGLEIRFVKDIGPYTKAIYAFKDFKDSIIVTADDDIYYPKDWLQKLYHSYISHSDDIQVHRAHRADLTSDYEKWEKHVNEETARYDNFLTGVGGVLYPPNCFSKEVLREDIFLQNSPKADDIWFWIMALIHNRKIRVVKNHIKSLISVNILKQLFKKNLYQLNSEGMNDTQLKNLLKFYRQNVENKLK